MRVAENTEFELFDAVGAVVVVLEPSGRIAHWNRAASELTGYGVEEVRGRSLADVVLRPEDAPRVDAAFSELVDTAEPSQFENVWVTKSGEERWLAWSNRVAWDAEGRVRYVIATGVDRTDARRADDRHRESEAKLDAIVSIAADAIIAIDERQRIVLFNYGAEEIFGWTADEVRGERLGRLIPERFARRHEAHVDAFGREADAARRMAERAPDIVGVRKNGEEFPAEAAISKVNVGGTRLFTVILRDISDRKLVERTLRDAITARDRLLGTVAHDLRNPVSSIGLQAKLLARPRRGDGPHPAVARIEEEARRMTRLIDDLLDYSRIETGGIALSREDSDPRELVSAAAASMRALAQASGLDIRLELPGELPRLLLDRDRIRQVLDNLLGNAIKFSEEGGIVRVAAEAGPEHVDFSVIDAGPGVSAEHERHLFEPFWQADHRDRRGAGLGLTICKQIVEAHGGRIEVEPAPGGGSRFFFHLPR